jgi:hypothetical protein
VYTLLAGLTCHAPSPDLTVYLINKVNAAANAPATPSAKADESGVSLCAVAQCVQVLCVCVRVRACASMCVGARVLAHAQSRRITVGAAASGTAAASAVRGCRRLRATTTWMRACA